VLLLLLFAAVAELAEAPKPSGDDRVIEPAEITEAPKPYGNSGYPVPVDVVGAM
jgi:hypothetical protein